MPLLPVPPPLDSKAALATTLLLRDVGDAALEEVSRVVEWLFLPGGDLLFRAGSVVESLLIVVSGRLQVLDCSDGTTYVVHEVLPGGSVGESSLLAEEPCAHSVRAARDTQLARVSRLQFEG